MTVKGTLPSASLPRLPASWGGTRAQKGFDLENQTVSPSLPDKRWLISRLDSLLALVIPSGF